MHLPYYIPSNLVGDQKDFDSNTKLNEIAAWVLRKEYPDARVLPSFDKKFRVLRNFFIKRRYNEILDL